MVGAQVSGAGVGKYIKVAFLNRWNLLAFIAGNLFALLTGRPDIFLPIVLAGETAYLAMLGTHPRFRKAVDAQEAAAQRQRDSRTTDEMLREILRSLPAPSLKRFENLRGRCHELHQIAAAMKRTSSALAGDTLESFQLAGLDRLLWIFLRMLHSQHALSRFLGQTSVDSIQRDIAAVEDRLANLPADESPHAQKLRRTLEDNLQTCQERQANHERAQANAVWVGLELDRLENKIKSLAEMAVNRQEPDYISSQVDLVANSMHETEKTMNDLQFATGLASVDEAVPDLVQTVVAQVAK